MSTLAPALVLNKCIAAERQLPVELSQQSAYLPSQFGLGVAHLSSGRCSMFAVAVSFFVSSEGLANVLSSGNQMVIYLDVTFFTIQLSGHQKPAGSSSVALPLLFTCLLKQGLRCVKKPANLLTPSQPSLQGSA
jgi:vacuolar-type H+-ATPase subunit I/STV1